MSDTPFDQNETLELWGEAGGDRSKGWDLIHTRGTIGQGNGTAPAEALMYLRADSLLTEPSGVILDIGVGTGAMSDYLSQRGYYPFGIDISEAALDTLAHKGYAVSLPSELAGIDGGIAAGALSFLCFQHATDDELPILLKHVFRILAKDAPLHFQWLDVKPGAEMPEWMQKDLDARFTFPRSRQVMTDIVTKSGGVPTVGWEVQVTPWATWWFMVAIPK